ncbi:MAG: hypothetical protein V4692_06875, partial [Bdellovibrionota bacterium]
MDLVPRKMNIKLYHSIDGIRYSDAIIIVPPTGGVNAIDLGYSNFFCQNGYAVALLDGFWKQNELDYDFQMHNYAAIRAIVAIKHTVVLLGQREVSTIGILGTSIGALTSAITLGFENKIKAATLIVGSARHADILVTSDEKSQVIPLRQLRMRKWGIKTIQGYGQAVRNAVRCEPGDYFLRHGARPVFAITATSDTTVLTKYQLELVEKLKASHISIPGGHMNAIISAYADYRY